MKTIKDMIRTNEGYRQFPYRCTADKLTIGIGRNLDDKGISPEEANMLLENDIAECITVLRRIFINFDNLKMF